MQNARSMASGVSMSVLQLPDGNWINDGFLLPAPDSAGDVVALQADVGQEPVIELAELALGVGAGEVALDGAHQARTGLEGMVAKGFAGQGDRGHFLTPVIAAGLHLRKSLCVAQRMSWM